MNNQKRDDILNLKVMENKNEPINPVVKPGFVYADGSHEESSVIANGLTKREYFAGLAMQGILANNNAFFADDPEILAEKSLKCADALLNQISQ